MFRFRRKPSSRSHSQYLAKITHLVQSGYVELVQDVISVMAVYCVILAKYRLCLPDDGFLVNRNMLEQFSLF